MHKGAVFLILSFALVHILRNSDRTWMVNFLFYRIQYGALFVNRSEATHLLGRVLRQCAVSRLLLPVIAATTLRVASPVSFVRLYNLPLEQYIVHHHPPVRHPALQLQMNYVLPLIYIWHCVILIEPPPTSQRLCLEDC